MGSRRCYRRAVVVGSRGGFAMAPFSWTTIKSGGFAAPIIADGKVFVFNHTKDMAAIERIQLLPQIHLLNLGVEKESLCTVLGHLRDTVYVYDARRVTLMAV